MCVPADGYGRCVSVHKPIDGRYTHDNFFEQQYADDCCCYAECHINDVVMAAVNGCPPYACADECKNGCGGMMLAASDGIYGGDKHICCM